ncbi:hypothetical protein [Lactiplantibacillus pentosus]|jgi:hypothetical protein|uniref:hypothetical protein n=1 Tax=Lactiplantibacillus pentosus TaxID=1589 RepID=UPI0021A4D951|nr:hypothetical protein [Lactiplantibacillus pentosus]MCT3287018.1 hypothetical protein [Lactiplantibacillus pentosus]
MMKRILTMPARNLNSTITENQMVHTNVNDAIRKSFNDTDTIKKNVSDILNVKEIKSTMEMLSKV